MKPPKINAGALRHPLDFLYDSERALLKQFFKILLFENLYS